MNSYSVNNLQVYLVNFRKNYRYYSLSNSEGNTPFNLDQYINDQADLAEIVYGAHGANMVKELAQQLANSGNLN